MKHGRQEIEPFMKTISLFQKPSAIFLIFSLSLSQSPSYAAAAPAPPLAVSERSRALLFLPEELGEIEESFQGSNGKTVIFIQDAHDSLEAQENIAKTIQYLVDKYGVKTVFEEGYEGPVPTDDYFGFIKDPSVKEKVSYFLLDKLRLGGAEYAHINRFHNLSFPHALSGNPNFRSPIETFGDDKKRVDFKLIGADNIKLHLENIDWYRQNAKHKEETGRDLTILQNEIDKLANRYFPKELKEWMKLKKRFDEKQIDLLDYLKRTIQVPHRESIDHKLYPNLSLLLQAEHTQDKEVLEKVKTIEAKILFEEIDSLENAAAGPFLQNGTDRKIFQYYKGINLLKRLNEIEITPAEYEAVKAQLQHLSTQELAQFIVQQTNKSIVLSKRWEENIESAIRFYQISRARDSAIAERLNDFLKNHDEKVAVLVFGGFHKERITELLRKKGLPYYIVSPRIMNVDNKHKELYAHLMTKGYSLFPVAANVAKAARLAGEIELAEMGGQNAKSELRAYHAAITNIVSSLVSNRPNQTSRELLDRLINGRLIHEVLKVSKQAMGKRRSELRSKESDFALREKRRDYLKRLMNQENKQWTLDELANATGQSTGQIVKDLRYLNLFKPSNHLNLDAERIDRRRQWGLPDYSDLDKLLPRLDEEFAYLHGEALFNFLAQKGRENDPVSMEAAIYGFYKFVGEKTPGNISERGRLLGERIYHYLRLRESMPSDGLRRNPDVEFDIGMAEKRKRESRLPKFGNIKTRRPKKKVSFSEAQQIMEEKNLHLDQSIAFVALSTAENETLFRALKSSELEESERRQIYDYLIQKHVGFVGWWIKHKMPPWYFEHFNFEELLAFGQIGLMKTIERYDFKMGRRFTSYAEWWIRHSIQRSIEKKTHKSLNVRRDEDSPEWIDTLSDSKDQSEEELWPELFSSLRHLDSRSRIMLSLRYGIGSVRTYNLREIGLMFGVTHERVRQITERAVEKLKRLVGKVTVDDSSQDHTDVFLFEAMELEPENPLFKPLSHLGVKKLDRIREVLSKENRFNSEMLMRIFRSRGQYVIAPSKYLWGLPAGLLETGGDTSHHFGSWNEEGGRHNIDLQKPKKIHFSNALTTTTEIIKRYPYARYLLPPEEQLLLASQAQGERSRFYALGKTLQWIGLSPQDFIIWLVENKKYLDQEIVDFIAQSPLSKRPRYELTASRTGEHLHGSLPRPRTDRKIATKWISTEETSYTLITPAELADRFPSAEPFLDKLEPQLLLEADSSEHDEIKYYSFVEDGHHTKILIRINKRTGEIQSPHDGPIGFRKEILDFVRKGEFGNKQKPPVTAPFEMHAGSRHFIYFGTMGKGSIGLSMKGVKPNTRVSGSAVHLEHAPLGMGPQWLLRLTVHLKRPRVVYARFKRSGTRLGLFKKSPQTYIGAFVKLGKWNQEKIQPFPENEIEITASSKGRLELGSNGDGERIVIHLPLLPKDHKVLIRKVRNQEDGQQLLVVHTRNPAYRYRKFYYRFTNRGYHTRRYHEEVKDISPTARRKLSYEEIAKAQEDLRSREGAEANLWRDPEKIAYELDLFDAYYLVSEVQRINASLVAQDTANLPPLEIDTSKIVELPTPAYDQVGDVYHAVPESSERPEKSEKPVKPKPLSPLRLAQKRLEEAEKKTLAERLKVGFRDVGESGRFLDLGAGKGDLTAELAGQFQGGVAVEINEDRVEQLRQRKIPNLNIWDMDFFDYMEMAIKGNQLFDAILISHALLFIKFDRRDAFLKDVLSRLKPNGKLAIILNGSKIEERNQVQLRAKLMRKHEALAGDNPSTNIESKLRQIGYGVQTERVRIIHETPSRDEMISIVKAILPREDRFRLSNITGFVDSVLKLPGEEKYRLYVDQDILWITHPRSEVRKQENVFAMVSVNDWQNFNRTNQNTEATATKAVVFIDGSVDSKDAKQRAEELAVLAAGNPNRTIVVYNADKVFKNKGGEMAELLKSFGLANVKFAAGELSEALKPYQFRDQVDLVHYSASEEEAVFVQASVGKWLAQKLTRFVGGPGALGYGIKYLQAVKLGKPVEGITPENGYYAVSPGASEWMRSLYRARFATVFAQAA